MLNLLEQKLLPTMSKIAEQKHLRAIRNGIVATIPVVIVGSFFLILLNIPLDPLGINWKKDVLAAINPMLETHLLMAFRLTVGLMALYSAFGIGVALGNEYEMDATTSGMVAVIAFLFSIVPVTITGDMIKAIDAAGIGKLAGGQYLSVASLGSASLFGAILYSLFAVEVTRLFKKWNITVKMPDSVPAAISNSFAALFSTGFVILFVWTLRFVIGFDLNQLITIILSPISRFLVGDNLLGIILIVFLVTFLWSFGLHGVSLVGTIVRPFWEQAIAHNGDVFQTTGNAVLAGSEYNMFPEQFLQWYIWIGGSGATLGLCFLLLFARSQFLKQMGRVTIVPALFNINEPVIFGLPIVMNPILIIPFMLAPLLMSLAAGAAHYMGLVNAMVTRPPWTLPAPLGAWMGTMWDWRAIVLCLVCIIISTIVYFPFFKAYDKKLFAEEQAVESK
ncbi:MAG: PTS sugar transporter subunit IIC [Culicoidibacterales bacterium]